MNTFHNDNASTRRTRTNEQGFTLIELLVVIAMLAVLPGLLPAIQEAREAAAHTKCSTSVNELIIASQEYRNRMGFYPRSVDEAIPEFVDDVVGATVGEVARGRKSGYLYEIVESDRDHCRIEAKPEYAGITGSLTIGAVVTRNDVRSYQIISAGADEAKERMFNNFRAKAAETVSRLLNFGDHSATSQVREYVESPDTTNGVYNTLDVDDDGRVSVKEILTSSSAIHDAELRRPVDQFLAYAAREMKLDSLSEEAKRTIDVGNGDLLLSADPPLFSYDGLRRLTKLWINQPDIANSLCANLDAAEAAEADGDNEDLEYFVLFMKSTYNQIRSQIGKAITGSNAKCLITLTEVMVSRH